MTRTRIYLETMSAVLPAAGKKLIFDDKAKGILPLFPGSGMGVGAAAAAAGGVEPEGKQ